MKQNWVYISLSVVSLLGASVLGTLAFWLNGNTQKAVYLASETAHAFVLLGILFCLLVVISLVYEVYSEWRGDGE